MLGVGLGVLRFAMRRRRPGRAAASLAALAGCLAVPGVASASGRDTCSAATVTVTVTWDRGRASTLSGLIARLHYPASLDLPVDPDSGSIKERVENRSGLKGGLFDAVRKPSDRAQADTPLNIGLIGRGIAVGEFARVHFVCRPGTQVPPASAFSCMSEGADDTGPVATACTIAVTD